MPTASAIHTIAAPATAVWNVLDDFGGIHRYHPEVMASYSTNHLSTGLGAERVCTFKQGDVLERIASYGPGQEMQVEIIDAGPFPLAAARATLRVKPLDGGHSRVTMEMTFTPKFGLAGKLMGPMMVRQFSSLMTRVLESLGDFVLSKPPSDDEAQKVAEPVPTA